MDAMAHRPTGPNKEQEDRNRLAWRRYSPDGDTCRFCPHPAGDHLARSGKPHFYRPAAPGEKPDSPYHILWNGRSLPLTKMLVSTEVDVIAVFCERCAGDKDTYQTVCYSRDWGLGEVVGLGPAGSGSVHGPVMRHGSQTPQVAWEE